MAKTGVVTGALWRVELWELVANDSFFFLSLDITPTGAVTRGLSGNAAVVAATGLALRRSSNSCWAMKVKENLGEAIWIRVSATILPWNLAWILVGWSWNLLRPISLRARRRRWIGYNYNMGFKFLFSCLWPALPSHHCGMRVHERQNCSNAWNALPRSHSHG